MGLSNSNYICLNNTIIWVTQHEKQCYKFLINFSFWALAHITWKNLPVTQSHSFPLARNEIKSNLIRNYKPSELIDLGRWTEICGIIRIKRSHLPVTCWWRVTEHQFHVGSPSSSGNPTTDAGAINHGSVVFTSYCSSSLDIFLGGEDLGQGNGTVVLRHGQSSSRSYFSTNLSLGEENYANCLFYFR